MTKDEALKLALEFLEDNKHYIIENERREYLLMYEAVIDKCKEALAQPKDHRRGADNQKVNKQEPVIGTKTWFEDGKVVTQYLYPSDIYTTPPQPEQEPVEWPRTMERGALVQWLHFEMVQHTLDEGTIDKLIEDAQAIPATPPQRTWVGLTDKEIETIWRKVEAGDFHDCVLPFAEKLEAKLKEKNT